jgi:hypothetical protein
MGHDKSVILAVIFFVVVLISGNIFWQMFSGGEDKDFELTKKEALDNLGKKQLASSVANNATAPANAEASAKTVPKAEVNSAENTQAEALKATESETEKLKDETADWKIYSDSKNKFELKYPETVSVVPSGDLIRVSQNNKTWKFRFFSNKGKADLQVWYDKAFSEKERKNCVFSESILKVGSYETKYVNPNSGETECGKAGYFAISSDKESLVRAEIGEETVENVNKILATFKFLTE